MCGRKGIMFVAPLILLGPMLSFLQYSISLNLQNNLEGKALSPFYRRDSRDSGTLADLPGGPGTSSLRCAIQSLALSVYSHFCLLPHCVSERGMHRALVSF